VLLAIIGNLLNFLKILAGELDPVPLAREADCLDLELPP
jgi:hypothetical protein